MINWKLLGGMNPSAENYLTIHRFGDFTAAADAHQVKGIVEQFHRQLHTTMNPMNLRGYIDTFVHRTNIAEKMGALTTPVLIITGKAAFTNLINSLHIRLI